MLRQGLIITLAYLMLIGPVCLQQSAHALSQYNQISTGNLVSGNRTIEYAYDANGFRRGGINDGALCRLITTLSATKQTQK